MEKCTKNEDIHRQRGKRKAKELRGYTAPFWHVGEEAKSLLSWPLTQL